MLSPRPGILPFSIAITALTLLGHLYLGFEQAWIQPIAAVLTAYACELAIELLVVGWGGARFRGSLSNLVTFLLPAHISGLAVGMLLFGNERTSLFAFAAAVAIFSKVLFRVPVPFQPGKSIHFLNPSNFGITASLVLFWEWAGIAPPYQFAEATSGLGDVVLPLVILCAGTVLNSLATKRITVSIGWVAGFVLQALCRGEVTDQSLLSLLSPISGPAFLLFTFYMITDPATTPVRVVPQLVFGGSTAMLYGFLTLIGVPFGVFFALTAVCFFRGMAIVWGHGILAANVAEGMRDENAANAARRTV